MMTERFEREKSALSLELQNLKLLVIHTEVVDGTQNQILELAFQYSDLKLRYS